MNSIEQKQSRNVKSSLEPLHGKQRNILAADSQQNGRLSPDGETIGLR